MIEKIIELRKELHQYPELSGREEGTAKRILDFIGEHPNLTVINNLGGTGVAVVYEYAPVGPAIMLRCELDALPIEEANTFEHRSKTKNVSHKCGHDGHMAIVAGLISWLKEQIFEIGRVILLFQPAEETGKGAMALLNNKNFKGLRPDYIFAFHNIPGEPLNSIILMNNSFSATVLSLSIQLTGKQSHASEPEKGINPALAMAEIIKAFAVHNQPAIELENFAVLTPVFSKMGSKDYGISAGTGELHYTLRTRSVQNMDQLKSNLLGILQEVTTKYALLFSVNWFDYFPATENNPECNNLIGFAADNNDFAVIKRPHPFKFGEDFGWFSPHYKAAMFGIGAGLDCPALHKDDYDFPDDIIETGSKMFQKIISTLLTKTL